MGIRQFFHHLFNPHCESCLHEHACKNCETLRELLEAERYDKKELLKELLEIVNPPPQVAVPNVVKTEPIRNNKHIPWEVKRQMLEEQDREQAKILKAKTTEELEQELGVNNG